MRKIEVGDTVKLVNNSTCSINPKGSIGVVSMDKYGDGSVFRVIVAGISNEDMGNGSLAEDLKLVLTTQEKIERLLKKISKLDKKQVK